MSSSPPVLNMYAAYFASYVPLTTSRSPPLLTAIAVLAYVFAVLVFLNVQPVSVVLVPFAPGVVVEVFFWTPLTSRQGAYTLVALTFVNVASEPTR